MSDCQAQLAELEVGDIFHAAYPNGASCICLIISVDETSLQTRRVTTQENIEFDRQTGIEKAADGEPLAVIDSVAPLPDEFHTIFLALDQKYRAVHGRDDVLEKDPEYFKLTEAEKKAFRFIDSHYASNPLPPAEP